MNKKEYLKQYRLEHQKEIKEYYILHKEEIRLKNLKNRLQRQEYNRQWRQKNHPYCLEYRKKYRQEHKLEILKYQNEHLKQDFSFKLAHYLRSRLWSALKGKVKFLSAPKLLGCTIEQLKERLESQFKQGMSWSNYGKWHIDHIKPCASFNLSKPEEQKICFNYRNLQPLWAEDNLRKQAKI
jgi:hypothetical protein